TPGARCSSTWRPSPRAACLAFRDVLASIVHRQGRGHARGDREHRAHVTDSESALFRAHLGTDVHAASAADQEVGGAEPEPVAQERVRIARDELEAAGRIGGRERTVREAEPALARPDAPLLHGEARAIDEHQSAAMTAAFEFEN